MTIIELSNINKTYKQKQLFHDFSLKIEQGEFICITGESGSGKSTLLNIIGLLEQPDQGVVNICGIKDVKMNSKISKQLLREKIGFLFQNYALVDDQSISYNLDIACKNLKYTKKEKIEIQKKTLDKLRLESDLNTKIYQLSGGEQQRVALARILIKNCDIILADEPTASLDVINRDMVLDCLKELNQLSKTIIIVSHDPYIIEQAERVLYL